MKTQEIAILDFGLGLDDEIGYGEIILYDTNIICNGCIENLLSCNTGTNCKCSDN